MQTFAAVWGFWPLILVGALQGSLKRSRKGKLGESILFNLLVAWGVFALLWLVATLSGYPPQGYFLSTEVNNGLFWTFGLILGAAQRQTWFRSVYKGQNIIAACSGH